MSQSKQSFRMLRISLKKNGCPLQTIVTLINRAIGAAGIGRPECKAVVSQHGKSIMDLLLAKVNHTIYFVGNVMSFNSQVEVLFLHSIDRYNQRRYVPKLGCAPLMEPMVLG